MTSSDDQSDDHRDAELEKGGRHQAQADPEQDTQLEGADPLDDRGAEDQHAGERQPDRSGEQRREAGEQQIDQRHERKHQIPLGAQRLQGVWAFVLGKAVKSAPHRLEVNAPKRGGEVQDGGNDRGLDHFRIGNVDGFGHDERNRAHHRRHDLSAHARRGLDPSGEIRAIAETLHQRNGELARGHHVGDARAGDRAHERRRDDGDLGGAAAGVSDQSEGDVGEELDHPRPLQKAPEQDEQEHETGRHIDRDAVDAFGAEGHVIDDLLEGVATVIERSRKVLSKEAVCEKASANERQSQP